MKPFPIRNRLTLWYTFILALVLLCFGLFLYFTTARALRSQVDTSLQLVAGQAAANVQDENGAPSLQNWDEPGPLPALLSTRGYVIRLLAKTGQVLDGGGEYRRLPAGVPTLGLTTCTVGGEPWRLYTVALPPLPDHESSSGAHVSLQVAHPQVAQAQAYLQVAQSLAGLAEAERRMRFLLAVGIPMALTLAAAAGAFLADRALRPIDRITREARRIGAQNLDRRLNLNLPDDEVGRLARTFDEMLSRLQEAFRRERQFTADAAHELRTPLTVLKGTMGVTLRRPRTAAQYRQVLQDLEKEVDRLISLAEDLLTLARSESQDAGRTGSIVDLARVAALAVERLQAFAIAKGVTLSVDVPLPLPVAGDADRLGQAIYNLIHNGIKYTPASGHVHISGRILAGSLAEVQVSDNGVGISAADLPHVFDRFFRVDKARTRGEGSGTSGETRAEVGGGAGLGLTIALTIARAYGGDIIATSTPGQGSTFALRLPVTEQPAPGGSRGRAALSA